MAIFGRHRVPYVARRTLKDNHANIHQYCVWQSHFYWRKKWKIYLKFLSYKIGSLTINVLDALLTVEDMLLFMWHMTSLLSRNNAFYFILSPSTWSQIRWIFDLIHSILVFSKSQPPFRFAPWLLVRHGSLMRLGTRSCQLRFDPYIFFAKTHVHIAQFPQHLHVDAVDGGEINPPSPPYPSLLGSLSQADTRKLTDRTVAIKPPERIRTIRHAGSHGCAMMSVSGKKRRTVIKEHNWDTREGWGTNIVSTTPARETHEERIPQLRRGRETVEKEK